MTNRRHEKRWAQRLPVVVIPHAQPDRRVRGYTTDVSLGGAYISTPSPLRTGQLVRLELGEAQKTCVLEAQIVRSKAVPRELQQVRQPGMAVRFLSLGEALQLVLPDLRRRATLIEDEVHDLDPDGEGAEPDAPEEREAETARHGEVIGEEGREEPAGTPKPIFRVAIDDLSELQRTYRSDLQFGGLFLPTDQVVESRTLVVVLLELGDGEPLREEAEVVRVWQPSGEQGENRMAGMGVRFLNAERVAEHARELLERAGLL